MRLQRAVAACSEVEGAARTVLLGLAFHAQKDTDLSWPSDSELMRWARVGKTRLHQLLRALERQGEIQRQPRQDGGPRRVYLVTPAGGGQLALALDEAKVHPGCTFPATQEGALLGDESSPHARAGKEPSEPTNSTPPGPPQRGDDARAGVLDRLHHPGQTPRAAAHAERAAGARRRRRRRGQQPTSVDLRALGPCPLHAAADSAASGREHLQDVWQQLVLPLRQIIGEDTYEIWLAGAHLHAVKPVLQLGVDPERLSWVDGRYGPVIARAADAAVQLVPCREAIA